MFLANSTEVADGVILTGDIVNVSLALCLCCRLWVASVHACAVYSAPFTSSTNDPTAAALKSSVQRSVYMYMYIHLYVYMYICIYVL
jgi:hypothetical protein